jgi:hypothetical protein
VPGAPTLRPNCVAPSYANKPFSMLSSAGRRGRVPCWRLWWLGLAITTTGCTRVPSPLETSLIPRPGAVTWGGLGLGVNSAGFEAQADIARVRADGVRRLRWNVQGDDGNWSGNAPRTVSELAFLAGRGQICCREAQWRSYAIGGAILAGSKGRAPADEFITAGLAGEFMIVTGRTPHLGVSINGNLNPELSFLGVNVAILIGRMPFVTTARPPRRPF